MKKLKTFFVVAGVFFMGLVHAQDAQSVKDKPLVVIFLGPPGAGKGTHAVELGKKLNLPHISTGDLFREHMKNETVLGKKAKSFIEQGKLVPDQLVIDMLFERIAQKDCAKGYILDGFPRTIAQAEILEKDLKNVQKKVLNLEIADKFLIERIVNRIVCKSCGNPYHKVFLPPKKAGKCDACGGELYQRKDDTEAVVKERLSVYHKETEPVIHFYEEKKLLIPVKADGSKDEVFQNILKALSK